MEGRLARGLCAAIRAHDFITFSQTCTREVEWVHRYSSFANLLDAEGLEKVLPGISSRDEGLLIYRGFYTAADEAHYGVVAFGLLAR